MSHPNASSLTFSISSSSSVALYGPRIGTILYRHQTGDAIKIQTPGLTTATSRGVVPHLSRDHHRATGAIRWVNVPFETL